MAPPRTPAPDASATSNASASAASATVSPLWPLQLTPSPMSPRHSLLPPSGLQQPPPLPPCSSGPQLPPPPQSVALPAAPSCPAGPAPLQGPAVRRSQQRQHQVTYIRADDAGNLVPGGYQCPRLAAVGSTDSSILLPVQDNAATATAATTSVAATDDNLLPARRRAPVQRAILRLLLLTLLPMFLRPLPLLLLPVLSLLWLPLPPLLVQPLPLLPPLEILNCSGLNGPDSQNNAVYLPKYSLMFVFHLLLLLLPLQLLLLPPPLQLPLLHLYKACVDQLNGPAADLTKVLGGTHRLPQLMWRRWLRWLLLLRRQLRCQLLPNLMRRLLLLPGWSFA